MASVSHSIDRAMTRGKLIIGGVHPESFPWRRDACHGAGQQPPVAAFKSSVDLVRIAAVVRDHEGALRPGPHGARFRGARRRPDAADQRSSQRPRRRQRRPALRRQRQHGRPAAERARSGDARPELARRDAGRGGGLHVRYAPRRAHAVHDRAAGAARLDDDGRAVRRDLASRRDRADGAPVGEREGRRRAVVVLHRRQRQREPAEAGEVSAIASAIDVPVYVFGIVPSIDNPSAENSTHSVESIGIRRSARRSRRLDRRTRVRGKHAGTAQRRGAADHRRAAASVPDRV